VLKSSWLPVMASTTSRPMIWRFRLRVGVVLTHIVTILAHRFVGGQLLQPVVVVLVQAVLVVVDDYLVRLPAVCEKRKLDYNLAMKLEDIIDLLKAQMPDLQRRFGVKRIGLFGSALTDRFSDQSDIDLIVEFERPIGFAFFDLVEHLEDILGRRVDVLTPDGVGSIRIPAIAETIRNSTIYV